MMTEIEIVIATCEIFVAYLNVHFHGNFRSKQPQKEGVEKNVRNADSCKFRNARNVTV